MTDKEMFEEYLNSLSDEEFREFCESYEADSYLASAENHEF